MHTYVFFWFLKLTERDQKWFISSDSEGDMLRIHICCYSNNVSVSMTQWDFLIQQVRTAVDSEDRILETLPFGHDILLRHWSSGENMNSSVYEHAILCYNEKRVGETRGCWTRNIAHFVWYYVCVSWIYLNCLDRCLYEKKKILFGITYWCSANQTVQTTK